MSKDNLEMYTVYFNTVDYPGEYVVRRWVVGPGSPEPQADKELFMRSTSFHMIREKLEYEMALAFLNRDFRDSPSIVGTYL